MNTQHALNRRHFIGFLGLAAGSSALALTPSRALAGFRLADDPILAWDELSKGVHAMVDASTGGNVLTVASADSVVLIDTKFAHLGRALLTDAQGFAPGDAKVVLINTHHHGDHTGGNGSIVPKAEASYAHENALPRIKDSFSSVKASARQAKKTVEGGGSVELIRSAIRTERAAAKWQRTSIVPETGVSGEKTSITAGELAMDLYHFGAGHTDNDLFVHIPEHNVLHTGDVVFNGLHSFFDQTAGYSTKGWVNSAKRGYELCDADTIVIPGHGPVGDRSILKAQSEYLEQLIEAVQAEIDKGTSKEATANKSWPFMEGLGFEGIRGRAINAVYDELAG
ncbi:MAG: MBL fold metallo-hydrolase [Phycisphaerales bacterium]|nr:MBL fold metallo-hydrolase [Phycisphaerales bacterium]